MAQGELRRMQRIGWLRRIAIAAGVLLLAVVVGVSIAVFVYCRTDRICKGVTVAGISVAGMSRAEAERAIDRWWSQRRRHKVTLTALDSRMSRTLEDLGANLDTRKTTAAAFAVGRRGGIIRRFEEVLLLLPDQKRIRPTITFDKSKLLAAVKQISRAVNRPHRNASLKVVHGRIQIEQDSAGIKIDEAGSQTVLMQALADGSSLVALPVEVDKPEVTAADASGIDTLLSRFTTAFNPGKRDRTHNLRLAAVATSGAILKPGGIFSINKLVGPRVTERGYRIAPIFVRGNLEPGVGGGVCQVASTIYNAALLAGLKIVERVRHARLVPYVGPGRDATVNYGHIDFRFQNSNPNPIGIIAEIKGSLLTVSIYGSASDKKRVSVYTSKPTYAAAGSKTVIDSRLAAGAKKVVDPGSPRVSVVVYRRITQADGTTRTEVVSRDNYPPRPRVVAYGPPRRNEIASQSLDPDQSQTSPLPAE